MRKVAVFFGGRSCENEISVLTGVFVLNVLDKEQFAPLPVYIHTDGGAYTSPEMTNLNFFREKRYGQMERVFFDGGGMYALNEKKRRVKSLGQVDVALNCCHGGLGEGGGVSAMMEWNEIPLASPDITSSGIFMDKSVTKLVMQALKIPTLEYVRVNEEDYEKRGAFLLKRVENKLKYPVVVKPAHLGSSIGITLANDEEELKAALRGGFELDDRVIVERYLEGKKDVNCAAYSLNGEIVVSEPEEAFGAGIYSFEEKYVKRSSDQPNKGKKGKAISGELREKIRAYTKTVYKRMNLRGVVRMDFLMQGEKAYLCEVNTVPGSLAYYLFCERILDARNFLSDLLRDAIAREGKEKKRLLRTGILRTVRWNAK